MFDFTQKRAYLNETLASLRFAARVAKIPITRNYVQTEPDPVLHAAILKEEVETLRRELQVQCLLTSGKHAIGTEPLTSNQLTEVNRQVDEYLAGGPVPDIISNRQLHAVFAAFRSILSKSESPDQEISETDLLTKGSAKSRSANTTGKGTKGKNDKEEKNKKEPDANRAASRKANKESLDQESKKIKSNLDKGKEMERKSSKQSNNTPIQSESVMDIMDKNNDLNESGDLLLNEQPDRETSFKMFGEDEGRELIRLLREAEKEASEKEEKAYNCAVRSNQRIEMRSQLKNTEFGTQLPDGRRVISEDELENIRKMRKLKEEILEQRQEYKILKAQAEYCREQAALTAERVMMEFEAWEQRNFQTQVTSPLNYFNKSFLATHWASIYDFTTTSIATHSVVLVTDCLNKYTILFLCICILQRRQLHWTMFFNSVLVMLLTDCVSTIYSFCTVG